MKGFKQSSKMSHGGHYCWGGKVMKKAEGGKVPNPNRFPTMSTPPTPIKRPGAPSVNLGSGGGSRPSINPALIENKPPRGGGGGPAPTMIPGPKPIGPIRPMPGGIKDKLQPVPLKPAPRELYLGGSKYFDESTGTYRGRPGGDMAFKKGGSIKGESEMKKSDSKMKVMKKAVGGGISGGPTRVGPKPMPSNPLNRGPISSSGGGGKPINLGSTPSMKGGSGKPINFPIDLGSTPSIKGGGGGGKIMKKAMGGGISSPIGRPNTAKPMPSNPSNRGPIGNLPTRANPTAPRQSNPMDRGSISRMKKGGSAKGRKGMK